MSQLLLVYPQAIEQTKNKIYEDIYYYLGSQADMPTLEQYLTDRKHYIDQIWVNVWLNKVTNKVPRNEKKSFLNERGYVVEGIDRKLINKLFRNEIRSYQPFDVIQWIEETFSNQEAQWEEKFKLARKDYLKRLEEKLHEEKIQHLQNKFKATAQDLIEENQELFYLYLRHHISKYLARDIRENRQYELTNSYQVEGKLKLVGDFYEADFKEVADFFQELTGDFDNIIYWGKNNYQFETYYDVYSKYISDFIFDFVPEWILDKMSSLPIEDEFKNYNVNSSQIKKWIVDYLTDLSTEFQAYIEDEELADLLKLAKYEFDEETHRAMLDQDYAERERREVQKLEEIQRKKDEEDRILDDIFGREYSPSLASKIKYVLHIGETNTGKTHHALERMKQAGSGQYLAPLRLLALEVYDKLNNEGIPCSLKTGEEEKEVEKASHISSTVEMFHEKEVYDVVVIDEAQMIADKDRGFSWYKAITKANANEVHIIGSRNLKTMMIQLLGESNIEINEYSRDIPLEVESKPFNINHTKKGDALICFSRRRVLETASKLQNDGKTVSMIYGSMPPETRKKQMQRFITGETNVIVSTDAIGMGLNLPIRRIVFLENDKFDGTRRRRLTSQEVKQIAGRAGRKGIYDVGKVAFTRDVKQMKRILEKPDVPVHTFAIAPTNNIFERFQRHSRNLGTFFELWNKFESPLGTKKASLIEERELYETIRDTEIEARLSMMDLYGFLHLPFSSNEATLRKQWKDTMLATVKGKELPEPKINRDSLESLELSYKAIGLHLLFLYRLGLRTETYYWERIREEISDAVHERLKTDVKSMTKKCKRCGRKLAWDHEYQICDSCHHSRYRDGYE